jgi:hypothetical protein
MGNYNFLSKEQEAKLNLLRDKNMLTSDEENTAKTYYAFKSIPQNIGTALCYALKDILEKYKDIE